MSWQDQYESAAERELQAYELLPVDILLNNVEQGQYGQYNMVWHAISDRASLSQAAIPLFRILQRNDVDYLIRCNCAEALLDLLGHNDDPLQHLQKAVDLTSGKPADRLPYLTALHEELAKRVEMPVL